MSKITRRRFVAGVSAVPLALSLGRYGFAFAPKVRYNATSVQGQAMLAIYEQGVAAMKSLPADNPISWVFQWYIHAVKSGATKPEELLRIFGIGGSPHKTLATNIWSTCAPHFGGDQRFFLPWHRMYLYYFENIIRAVTGRDDFTLPYWNYTANAVIPAEFRDPTSSLYVANRNVPARSTDRIPNVNGGDAIDRYAPGALDPASALGRMRYAAWFFNLVPGFCDEIETTVHNNVHGLVGNNRNMGSVPWAANDPVFWLHHCNIDRLWASWNRSGGANPTDTPFLDRTYTFADTSGNGVDAVVRDFLDIATLDYTYAEFAPAQAPATARANKPAPEGRPAVLYRMPEKTALTRHSTHIRLKAVPGARAKRPSRSRASGASGVTWYLVLKNFETNEQPGVLYDVFLVLGGVQHPVGRISFFDAMDLSDGTGAAMADFYSFDITRFAAQLQPGQEPQITLAPIGTPVTGSEPTVGTIEIVEAPSQPPS